MQPHRDLLDRINEAQVTDICRALVRFKTINPPGDELPAAEYVAGLLDKAGFEIRFVRHTETRASVIARLKGQGTAPALLLNGHLDVVPPGAAPWRYDPFEAQVDDGKIWGRGSADMKGGVAAILAAAQAIAQAQAPLNGDLIIAATADEEVKMEGARQVADCADLGPLQAVIIAEPTNNQMGLAERGVLWVQLETYGKTAHGATPHLGENAVMMMAHLLVELERLEIPHTPHPILGGFSRSINTISGGAKTNVVPDYCIATVDMRTVPGQNHQAILDQIEQLITTLQQRLAPFKARVSAAYELPPVETRESHPAVQAFARALTSITGRPAIPAQVRFATEAGIYVPTLGVPAIICGPGDPALAHQPDEHVEIEQLVQAAKIYALAAVMMGEK